MNKNSSLFGSFVLLAVALLWGFSFSLQTLMSYNVGPFTIIFLKGFGGLLIIGYCILARKKIDKKTMKYGILSGLVNGSGLLLQQIAFTKSSVSKVSFITGLYVVIVPLLLLCKHKKPKPRFWLGLLVACIGLYMLCLAEQLTIVPADLIALVAALCFALQIVIIGAYAKYVEPITFCGVQQGITSVICGIIMLLTENTHISDFSGIVLPSLYVVLIPGLLAQILQAKYQHKVDTNIASLILSLESIFGALSGIIILNQVMTTKEIIGCILLFVSILIAN